jgi:hypothetical protein
MNDLTPKHHALFFSWIVEDIFNYAGRDEAEDVIKEIVMQYGRERGRRMAYRVKENGGVLDMTTYLDYIEWQADSDEAEWVTEVKNGDTYTKVLKCPWFTAWKDNDSVKYGKYYCKYIDDALLDGFNPELKVEVKSILPESNEYCCFIFYDGIREDSSLSYIKPWEFHIAHLAHSVKEMLSKMLTEEVAVQIMYKAIDKFRHDFGDEACLKIIKYENTDFSKG